MSLSSIGNKINQVNNKGKRNTFFKDTYYIGQINENREKMIQYLFTADCQTINIGR